jgi:hypothetical protein
MASECGWDFDGDVGMGEADSEVGVALLNGSILESCKLLERECD